MKQPSLLKLLGAPSPDSIGRGALLLILTLVTSLTGCTDAVMNPEQVIPDVGVVYRGHGLFRNDTAVIDSASGEALRLVFARLGNRVDGDGTYESPCNSLGSALAAAGAGDIVLVFRGTDPGVPDFRVPEGVRLFSDHPYQRISTRNFGFMTLPLTGTEPPPRVTGTAVLDNRTEIAGFQFVSDTGHGIRARDVADVVIRDNRFVNTFRQGVYLLDVSGRILIHDNQVFATQEDSTSPGIFLENTRVTMNARIFRNSVHRPAGDGIKIQTRLSGITVATVDSNTVSESVGSGIKFFSFNQANTTAVISNNVVTRNRLEFAQDGAIRFGTFDDIRGNVTVLNNRITDCASNGIFIGSEHQARTEVNILGNDVSECVGNGIFVGAQQTSFQRALISDNYVRNVRINTESVGFPSGHGIFLGALYTGSVDGTIVFNRLYENSKNGLFCASFNSGSVTALVADNLFSHNESNGFEINCGLNVPPPGPNQVPPPLPPPGVNRGRFRVFNNVVAGNHGRGDPGQEGGGIMNLGFNGTDMEVLLQGNHINANGDGNGAYAGLGILIFDQATANIALRFNTLALNPASPAVNARTFAAIPPNIPVPGQTSSLCLELTGNVSDTGFQLTRDDLTAFSASLAANQGFIMIPSPLGSDPECPPLAPAPAGFGLGSQPLTGMGQ